MALEQLVNGNITTSVSTSINTSVTTLIVASSSNFPSAGNFYIRIEDEIIQVTAVSGTTWTIVRGVDGSSVASHSSGATVAFMLVRATLTNLRIEMAKAGTYASRVTAPRTGAIHIVNNGNVICRYNGSAWEEFGPINPINSPGNSFSAGYSWVNQGSSTFTQNGTSWIFKIPAETSGAVRMLVKSAPSTPYTIEMGIRYVARDANYVGAGLIWRSSGDSKHTHCGCMYHSSPGTHAGADKYDSGGGYNSSYNSPVTNNPRWSMLNYPQFIRIKDNGTDRFFQFSQDSIYWMPWLQMGRTDFHTPNQVGFGMQVSNNFDAYMEVFHYKEY